MRNLSDSHTHRHSLVFAIAVLACGVTHLASEARAQGSDGQDPVGQDPDVKGTKDITESDEPLPYGFDRGGEEFGIRSIVMRQGYLDAASRIGQGSTEDDVRPAISDLEVVMKAWRSDPDVFLAAYNIACGYCKIGELDTGFQWLERAFSLGYGVHRGNLETISQDPDLEMARTDARFESLFKKMVERYDGIRKQWPETKKAYVRVPKNMEPGTLAPACIVFHDYGAGKRETADTIFGPIADELGIILIAPQGPRLVAPNRYCWFDTDGEFLERYRLTNKQVWKEYNQLLKQYPIDSKRVFVAGFGQGATMAFPFAVRNPQIFAGMLGISGNYWPEAMAGGWVERSGTKRMPLCMIAGAQETDVRSKLADRAIFLLQSAGARVHRIQHAGSGLEELDTFLIGDGFRWLLEQTSPPKKDGSQKQG